MGLAPDRRLAMSSPGRLALLASLPFLFLGVSAIEDRPPAAVTGAMARMAAAQAPAAHMADHFSRVDSIQEAVIRGHVEDVREAARWLAEHQTAEGLPSSAAPFVEEMRAHARRVAEADSLEMIAGAAAMLAATCGKCHRAVGAKLQMPVPEPPVAGQGTRPHMLEHQWAADLMYQGLIEPSDEAWIKGARAFREAPLTKKDLPADAALAKEMRTLEERIHQVADDAPRVGEATSRAALYGRILASCGRCHDLHGRVLGPKVGGGQ
jgi:cytochrome c553